MHLPQLVALLSTFASAANALPRSQPFKQSLRLRQASSSALEVDLGYEIYRGSANSSTAINTWRGIRFADPPTGALRWQRPEAPTVNRNATLQADRYGPTCYQIGSSGSSPGNGSGSSGMQISEDCLFLNVQSPANATNLPVLVWIHGGGYGAGNGRQDFTDLLTTNGNNFVVVSIQYRLGPFGFLASDEVFRQGVANAGLLDQFFALQWVQTYISQFGGDSSLVTIAGESAGGGSVMLQDMAYGGSLGESLFQGTIAASPYLPKQYGYKDWMPTQAYYAFAASAGCPFGAYSRASGTIFDCLVSKDAKTLQNASIALTMTGMSGTWVFLPVTDGVFLQDVPSRQLLEQRLNGRNLLVGNNANEGISFVPQNITTEDRFVQWVRDTLPEFGENDIAKVLRYYPSSNASDDPNSNKFATSGSSGPSALNQSSLATGQQQRAGNLYAELTFVCPSYWMAEAYSGEGRTSYKYQYSALPATHGADVGAYFGPLGGPAALSKDYQRSFMKLWGNFVTQQNPSIPREFAVGSSSNVTAETNAASMWPAFSIAEPYQLDLNQTGGMVTIGGSANTTFLTGSTRRNDFTLVNAYTWENGRGVRCDFWRSVASIVPA